MAIFSSSLIQPRGEVLEGTELCSSKVIQVVKVIETGKGYPPAAAKRDTPVTSDYVL